MSTHTPGPLKIEGPRAFARDGYALTIILPHTTLEQARTMGSLIAQAPAMLRVLRHVVKWSDKPLSEFPIFDDDARAILRAIDPASEED